MSRVMGTGEILDELRFVIMERRAQIKAIQRERNETEVLKAIRISIAEKMIARIEAAIQIVGDAA